MFEDYSQLRVPIILKSVEDYYQSIAPFIHKIFEVHSQ
jgi:hypothetical protein